MRYAPIDKKETIKKLKKIVEKQKAYRRCNLTSSDIAEEMGISRAKLSTIINAEMGITFTEYVNHLRMKHAEQLIAKNTKGWTMEEITLMSGFSCPSSYYRNIKKKQYKK